MVDAAQRRESTQLHPARVEFRRAGIVGDVSAIARDVARGEGDDAQSGRQQHRYLVGHLPPSLVHVVGIAAVSRPTEGVALQAGEGGACHLEDAPVGVTLLELLLHHLVPGEAVDVVHLVVHAQVVLHREAFRLVFVAPGRLAHVCPKAGDAVVQGFLLQLSPPVGHAGTGKVHHAAVTAPGPGHVVGLARQGVRHEVTEAVGLLPLGAVGLRHHGVLRHDDLEAHFFQVGQHLPGVVVIARTPLEVLQVFRPADVLVDDVAGNTPLAIPLGYFAGQLLVRQQTARLGKAERPARGHDGLAGQGDVLPDDVFVVPPKDKVIDHLPAGHLERVVVAALGTELELALVRIVHENAVSVAAQKEGNGLIEWVLDGAVTRLVAVPHLIGFAPSVQGAGLLAQPEEVFVAAQGLVLRLALSVAQVSAVGVVAEQEFLVFVEHLQAEGRFAHADAQLGGEDFVAGVLLVHPDVAHVLQVFFDHCERRVAALETAVGRKPHAHHRGAAQAQLHGRRIVEQEGDGTALLPVGQAVAHPVGGTESEADESQQQGTEISGMFHCQCCV